MLARSTELFGAAKDMEKAVTGDWHTWKKSGDS